MSTHPPRDLHRRRGSEAIAIGERRAEDALDELLAALRNDPDFFVREMVTWALVRLGWTTVEPLIDLTRDPMSRVRHDAVHAFSKLGYDRASLAVWERLWDDDEHVAAKAAYTLGVLRERGAARELVDFLDHDASIVRTSATEALQRLGDLAIDELRRGLVEGSVPARERVANVLGGIGGSRAVEVLRQGLDDTSWQVRVAVLMALSSAPGKRAHDTIETAGDDPDTRVRAVAERLVRDRTR